MNDFTNIKDKSPLSNTNAVLILVTYFLAYFLLIPIIFYAIDELVIPGFSTNPIVDISFHTLMTLLFLFLASKLLEESNKHWSRMAIFVPIISAALMIYGSGMLNMAAQSLSGQTDPLNQELLFEQFQSNKTVIMIQAIVFAPIVEEIVFRGVLYRHFKKAGRYLVPLLVSMLVFALMHSLNSILLGQWADLWYLPVYAFMGLMMTYTYEKTQNLYSAMLLHFINNTISIIAMLMMVK